MTDNGILLVFSAPSGCGKDTILEKLTKLDENVRVSISMTTREIRDGEVDGVNYYFVKKDYFEKKISDNKMLEYAQYADNYYGTPAEPVEEMISQGKAVILKIEVQGAEKIREKHPDVVSIFVMPPSLQVLEQRLRGRGTEDEETIQHRLVIAREEIRRASEYDYIVVNDDLDKAVADVETIINSERMKTSRNKDFISEVINNV